MRLTVAAVALLAVMSFAAAEPLPLDAQHAELVISPSYGRGPEEPRDPKLLAECQTLARSNDLELYSYHERLVGNSVAMLATCIRTEDGGLVLVGTTGSEEPKPGEKVVAAAVVRLDKARKLVWRKELRKAGTLSIEGESAALAPGGDLIIATQVYYFPGAPGTPWLLRFGADGTQRWELLFKGKGRPGTPLPDTFRLLSDGTIFAEGHIYKSKAELRKEISREWSGIITAAGKLTKAKIGKPQ